MTNQQQDPQVNNFSLSFLFFVLGSLVLDFADISNEVKKRIEIDLFGDNLMELKGGEDKVELLMTDKLEPFHLFLQSQIVTTAKVGKETLGDGEIQIYIEGIHANQTIRTPLHFEKVKNYSFFPGQTIALRGNNPSSKLFRASAIRYVSISMFFVLFFFPHSNFLCAATFIATISN